MPLVTWDASYSVNVATCDEDHKKLFAVVNTLHEAMVDGKGFQLLPQIATQLVDYTNLHFSREESLLEKTNFPGLNQHRAQHRRFVKKVEQFRQDLEAGRTVRSVLVLNYLKDWLTYHTKHIDRQYSAHLNKNGVF